MHHLKLASVAQGIEHWFPKPCAHVRVMPEAPICLLQNQKKVPGYFLDFRKK
jgi:hypothetical protein